MALGVVVGRPDGAGVDGAGVGEAVGASDGAGDGTVVGVGVGSAVGGLVGAGTGLAGKRSAARRLRGGRGSGYRRRAWDWQRVANPRHRRSRQRRTRCRHRRGHGVGLAGRRRRRGRDVGDGVGDSAAATTTTPARLDVPARGYRQVRLPLLTDSAIAASTLAADRRRSARRAIDAHRRRDVALEDCSSRAPRPGARRAETVLINAKVGEGRRESRD